MMHHYQNRCLDEPSARAQRLHSIQMLAPSLAHRAQVFIREREASCHVGATCHSNHDKVRQEGYEFDHDLWNAVK